MLPTACHEIPSTRPTVVRSVTCARYAVNSSTDAVNTLRLDAHDTASNTGVVPRGACRHCRVAAVDESDDGVIRASPVGPLRPFQRRVLALESPAWSAEVRRTRLAG